MDTPPPVGQPPKKGLSGLAIAGIGCGALILVAFIAFVGLGMWGVSKVKEVAGEDWQKNPVKAGMMLALKMNPEIEIVSTDDAKGEVTIKNKKSGETITMSYDEAAKGKFEISTSKGERVTFDGSQAGQGAVRVRTNDGETVLGTAAASAPPSWVPVPEGLVSEKRGGMRVNNAQGESGLLAGEVPGTSQEAAAKYEAVLKSAGFETTKSSVAIGTGSTEIIDCKKDGGKTAVKVTVTQGDGKAAFSIHYSQQKQ